jgi:tripartite-type tricarboxylate transporter receptor subunit TctC
MKAFHRRQALALAGAALLPAWAAAQAQPRIERPIRIVVPYPPGGTTDLLARTVGARLSQRLGQPVLIENKAGAGGVVGSQQVARAAADGTTLLLSTIASHGIIPALQNPPPYDPVHGFTPITVIAGTPNVLLVNKDLPVRTLEDFLALARSKPGALNFGSTSLGGSPHMSGELLKVTAKINMVHVPYKGGGPMMVDLVGGQIPAGFDNLPSAMAQIRGGKVRALAVTTSKRWPTAPEIPTMAEAGVPGYEMSAWFGLMGPPGMSKPMAQMLQREVAAILQEPEVRKRLLELGADPSGITPDEFTRFLVAEHEKWTRVGAEAGVKLD